MPSRVGVAVIGADVAASAGRDAAAGTESAEGRSETDGASTGAALGVSSALDCEPDVDAEVDAAVDVDVDVDDMSAPPLRARPGEFPGADDDGASETEGVAEARGAGMPAVLASSGPEAESEAARTRLISSGSSGGTAPSVTCSPVDRPMGSESARVGRSSADAGERDGGTDPRTRVPPDSGGIDSAVGAPGTSGSLVGIMVIGGRTGSSASRASVSRGRSASRGSIGVVTRPRDARRRSTGAFVEASVSAEGGSVGGAKLPSGAVEAAAFIAGTVLPVTARRTSLTEGSTAAVSDGLSANEASGDAAGGVGLGVAVSRRGAGTGGRSCGMSSSSSSSPASGSRCRSSDWRGRRRPRARRARPVTMPSCSAETPWVSGSLVIAIGRRVTMYSEDACWRCTGRPKVGRIGGRSMKSPRCSPMESRAPRSSPRSVSSGASAGERSGASSVTESGSPARRRNRSRTPTCYSSETARLKFDTMPVIRCRTPCVRSRRSSRDQCR